MSMSFCVVLSYIGECLAILTKYLKEVHNFKSNSELEQATKPDL
jgi:hypothetical protein